MKFRAAENTGKKILLSFVFMIKYAVIYGLFPKKLKNWGKPL
jgi:uncharacterized membrane protein